MSLSLSSSPRQGLLGHILVAFGACALTVAICGSTIFLIYRIYNRYQLRAQVREVLVSLPNRTPEEIETRAAQVRARPKMARLVLPEVLHTLRTSRSEDQQYATILVLRHFVDNKDVEKALFRLRRDTRATVSAAAVEALTAVQPPERAAAILGQMLDESETSPLTPAAIDEVCAGLVRLGEIGRRTMEPRLARLSVDRRLWLTKFVDDRAGGDRVPWLTLLLRDPDDRVRNAARAALQPRPQGRAPIAAAAPPSAAPQPN